MKLPSFNNLYDPWHKFLYNHDVQEFHSPAPFNFSSLVYMNRFNIVLEAVMICYKLLGKSPEEIEILDFGCAQGNFSLTLAESGFKVFAVDINFKFLEYLKLKHEKGSVYPVNASLTAPPFKEKFDIILLSDVIQNAAHPDDILKKLSLLIKGNGYLVLSTPNGGRLHTGLQTLYEIKDRKSLELKQFNPDADGFLYFFTKYELKKEVQKVGFKVIKHKYYGSPWITGRLMFRYFVRFLPLKSRNFLDKFFLWSPFLNKFFAEGHLVIAQKSTS